MKKLKKSMLISLIIFSLLFAATLFASFFYVPNHNIDNIDMLLAVANYFFGTVWLSLILAFGFLAWDKKMEKRRQKKAAQQRALEKQKELAALQAQLDENPEINLQTNDLAE